jgi:manganese transport protein
VDAAARLPLCRSSRGTLLVVIAVCFGIQIAMADPNWGEVIRGFAPTVEIVKNPEMLYLALGILGATVMPHNLYLHSGIVQTRRFGESVPEKREAIKLATIDSTIALMFALLINASILILAASTFHRTGQTDVAELGEVYKFLAPLLGSAAAPSLFALALLACGLNSTGRPISGGCSRGPSPSCLPPSSPSGMEPRARPSCSSLARWC